MSLVIFEIADETLAAMSPARRRELVLALHELNEDASDSGLEVDGGPVCISRGPHGGLKLTCDGETLALNRQEFEASVAAYGSAMERLSRACATPFGPQNLQRFDEAKGRVHRRGAAMMRAILAPRFTLNELVSRRLYTVVYLVKTGSSASRVMRHTSDPEPN